MRLFISINLPAELYPYCQSLQAHFPGLKKTEAFHLTLQFLGDDTPEERVPAIIDKLSKINFQPFKIELGDAMPFPDEKRPRGVWIDCLMTLPLKKLADDIRQAMSSLGFFPDKPFAAHITLGRYKKNPQAIPSSIQGEPHRFMVDRFYLMRSHLASEGLRYEVIREFQEIFSE